MNEADASTGRRRMERTIERGVADIVAGIVGELRGNATAFQRRQNRLRRKRRERAFPALRASRVPISARLRKHPASSDRSGSHRRSRCESLSHCRSARSAPPRPARSVDRVGGVSPMTARIRWEAPLLSQRSHRMTLASPLRAHARALRSDSPVHLGTGRSRSATATVRQPSSPQICSRQIRTRRAASPSSTGSPRRLTERPGGTPSRRRLPSTPSPAIIAAKQHRRKPVNLAATPGSRALQRHCPL